MADYRVISSDGHIEEQRDLWTNRIEPKFKDLAPRIVREGDIDFWYVGDRQLMSSGTSGQVGMRFDDPGKQTMRERTENARPGAYIPEEQVKDMKADGVDINIIYPSLGLMMYGVAGSELLTAILHAYNDYIAEFCKAFPHHLKGIAMLNVDEVDVAIKELERCAKMGLVGAMITVYPFEDRAYHSPEYNPLWAAAQDLEIPLSLHVGTNRPGPGQEHEVLNFSPAYVTNYDHWVRMSLAHIILSGVFERYPKLQVGTVEHEISFIPHFLDRMDYTYTQRPVYGDLWYRYQEDMLPSDYFHRNVFCSFQEDALGVRDRHIIGVDNLLWGSDYPHFESTFPRSREILEEILADCTEEEKAKIAGGNAARVYNF